MRSIVPAKSHTVLVLSIMFGVSCAADTNILPQSVQLGQVMRFNPLLQGSSVGTPTNVVGSPGELRLSVPYRLTKCDGISRMSATVLGTSYPQLWTSNNPGIAVNAAVVPGAVEVPTSAGFFHIPKSAEIVIQYTGIAPAHTSGLQISIQCGYLGGPMPNPQDSHDSPSGGASPPGVPGMPERILDVWQILASEDFLLPHDWSSEDQDGDQIFDWKEQRLLDKFAPEVRLHPDDWTWPSSVDWWLGRTRMGFNHPLCKDCDVLTLGAPTQDNISTKGHRPMHIRPSCSHYGDAHSIRSNASADFYLTAPCSSKDINKTHSSPPPADDVHRGDQSGWWTTYAHVFVPADKPNSYFIQYWFFYPYNDFKGVAGHEGDWEHVTVEVDKASETAMAVYFSQHDGGVLRSVSSVTWVEQTHPVVYSAKGSHASYPQAGQWDVAFPYPDWAPTLVSRAIYDALMHDHAADAGPTWRTWVRPLVNIGEKDRPLNNQPFTLYGGRWGEFGPYGALTSSGPFSFKTGPTGPTFKNTKRGQSGYMEGWLGY